MSCGDPHTDCGKVIEQVYLYLDGELSDSDCAELRTHLDDCADCLREYGLEQQFKALVARSCPCDETPPDLKAQVLDKLRAVRAELAHVEYQPE